MICCQKYAKKELKNLTLPLLIKVILKKESASVASVAWANEPIVNSLFVHGVIHHTLRTNISGN